MELKHLRSFLHIAQLGSISLAAERLNIVQPALSRQMRALEQELDVTLLRRHARGVELAPAGERLLVHAEIILREIDRLRLGLKADAVVAGEVAFGMPPTVANVLAGFLFERLAATYPDLRLKAVSAYSGHLLDWLQRGSLDVGVLYDTGQRLPTVETRPLFTESLFLIEPVERSPIAEGIPFEEVAARRLVLPSREHGLRILIDNVAARNNVDLAPVAETDSLPIQIDLVRRGFGATILPLAPVFAAVGTGELTVTEIIDPRITRSLLLGVNIDRPRKAVTDVLVDTVVTEVMEMVRTGNWPGIIPAHDTSQDMP